MLFPVSQDDQNQPKSTKINPEKPARLFWLGCGEPKQAPPPKTTPFSLGLGLVWSGVNRETLEKPKNYEKA
jgi:hypothetical protein